jgi:single-strand DNA-binding protein
MNKVILIGNLTTDPELKYLEGSGKAIAKFTLAVADRFNKDKTIFVSCVAWGKTAEVAAEYLKKGNKAGVVGSLVIRNYDDKDGNKRKATEINVEEIEFLTPKTNGDRTSSVNQDCKDDWEGLGREVDNGDDIPF